MIQAQNQVYNAFKEAGLEREARQLSETIEDNEGKTKVVPALGHYIALLDSMLSKVENLDHHISKVLIEAKNKMAYYLHSIKDSKEYSKLKKDLYPNIFNQLDTVQKTN